MEEAIVRGDAGEGRIPGMQAQQCGGRNRPPLLRQRRGVHGQLQRLQRLLVQLDARRRAALVVDQQSVPADAVDAVDAQRHARLPAAPPDLLLALLHRERRPAALELEHLRDSAPGALALAFQHGGGQVARRGRGRDGKLPALLDQLRLGPFIQRQQRRLAAQPVPQVLQQQVQQAAAHERRHALGKASRRRGAQPVLGLGAERTGLLRGQQRGAALERRVRCREGERLELLVAGRTGTRCRRGGHGRSTVRPCVDGAGQRRRPVFHVALARRIAQHQLRATGAPARQRPGRLLTALGRACLGPAGPALFGQGNPGIRPRRRRPAGLRQPEHPDAVVADHRIGQAGREGDGGIAAGGLVARLSRQVRQAPQRGPGGQGWQHRVQAGELVQQLVPARQALFLAGIQRRGAGEAGGLQHGRVQPRPFSAAAAGADIERGAGLGQPGGQLAGRLLAFGVRAQRLQQPGPGPAGQSLLAQPGGQPQPRCIGQQAEVGTAQQCLQRGRPGRIRQRQLQRRQRIGRQRLVQQRLTALHRQPARAGCVVSIRAAGQRIPEQRALDRQRGLGAGRQHQQPGLRIALDVLAAPARAGRQFGGKVGGAQPLRGRLDGGIRQHQQQCFPRPAARSQFFLQWREARHADDPWRGHLRQEREVGGARQAQ